MPVSAEQFRSLMGSFASGVTVVTTVGEDGRQWGLTATSFTSLSLDPPQCLFCLDKRAGSVGAFTGSGKFAVNFLSAQQEQLSNHFASPLENKFIDLDFENAPVTGCPVFPDAIAWVECTVQDVLPGGDHHIFVGNLESVQVNDGSPLLYWSGGYGDFQPR